LVNKGGVILQTIDYKVWNIKQLRREIDMYT